MQHNRQQKLVGQVSDIFQSHQASPAPEAPKVCRDARIDGPENTLI